MALAEKKIDRSYWIAALILTVGVRLYLFKNYYTINNDGVIYIEAARHFWEREWGEGLASFYPPLFPWMIASVYPLVRDWELAGQFWPLVLSVLMLLPLFALLRTIYGSRVAHMALLFYGISPYLARLSLEVRTELPYTFFLVSALYLFQRGMDRGNLLAFFSTGLSSALAYLIRPEGAGLIIVGVSFLVYRRWIMERLEKCGLKAAVLILGFVIFSTPYILYLRWDTGSWTISRKTGLIVSMALAKHGVDLEDASMMESDQVSLVHFIASQPLVYFRKVLVDAFRSLGFYFEALHYSYLPFLFIGWFFFFRGRFWEKSDFLFLVLVTFYLGTFALLYVTRRYGIPLAALSLGWVAVGFVAMRDYFDNRWGKRGVVLTGIVLFLFTIGTLPKTLHAIGADKSHFKEAGLYLRGKQGEPTIVTTNGRVAFYARGQNRVLVEDVETLPAFLGKGKGDYLAVEAEIFERFEASVGDQGWLPEREFSHGGRERLLVFRRAGVS